MRLRAISVGSCCSAVRWARTTSIATPGLAIEAGLVRQAADLGVPVLGTCLGHQMVATALFVAPDPGEYLLYDRKYSYLENGGGALGAELHPGTAAEVGVGEVDVLAGGVLGQRGDRTPVLHWHFDVVDAPPGAVVQASTPQTSNQAFTLGDTIFGTQFHVEVTPPGLAGWLAEPAMTADLPEGLQATLVDDLTAAADRIEPSATRLFEAFAAGLGD